MKFKETVKLAFDSIRISKVRTFITSAIIAIGIMALVGILSSVDAMKSYLSQSFSEMGANSFNIKNRSRQIHFGGRGRRKEVNPKITYEDALRFKTDYNAFKSTVALSVNASFASTVKYKSNKTNPNTVVLGIDENYLGVSGYKLSKGRSITLADVESSSAVGVIGSDIASKLFPNKGNPLDKEVSIGGMKLRVIGVLESKGNSAGFGGGDKLVYVPLSYAKSRMASPNASYMITVQVNSVDMLDPAIGEAQGIFRTIRKRHPLEEDNFEITKSDGLAQDFIKDLSMLTLAANIISAITLLGSLIALMNIMLVTVTERTREIGIRKSLGATKSIIRKQFLYEAVAISLVGGIVGIILGLAVGNLISAALGVGFIAPWQWVTLAVIISILVGVAGGYYPARKASQLDPIEALRFE